MSGWAHHPYSLELAPSRKDPNRDNVVLSGIGRLTRTLDRIFRRYGQTRLLPIWLTEYGYQTDPPDPVIGHSWGRQAAWLNEAEYLAFRRGRVSSMAQFLLVDDGPNTRYPPTSLRYWGSTFQSGLVTREGRYKPSFAAYQRPIDVTPRLTRRGRLLRVFGQLRPAPERAALSARIELRRRGSPRFRLVRTASTRNRRNYLLTHVFAAASGWYRIAWRDPRTGRTLYSRAVGVRVVKPKKRRKRGIRRRRR
jgi:hypothetical protein